MKSSYLTNVRFILALITILILFIHPKIPLKRLVIHPQTYTHQAIFSITSKTSWLDYHEHTWLCENAQNSNTTDCGYNISWFNFDTNSKTASSGSTYPYCSQASPISINNAYDHDKGSICLNRHYKHSEGNPPYPKNTINKQDTNENKPNNAAINISEFDKLVIDINYEGSAETIGISLQGYVPELSTKDIQHKQKVMTGYVKSQNLKAGPTSLPLNEINVDEWWIVSNDIPRSLAGRDFSRITAFITFHTEPGYHKTKVNRVEVVGEYIKRDDLMVLLISFWVIFLLMELAIRYLLLRKTIKNREVTISQLSDETEILKAEKTELALLSITDNLTGTLNRQGIAPFINEFFSYKHDNEEIGLLILDIDHFKKINDDYGHNFGDIIIKSFANLISNTIRDQDMFARWGGEEFVILSPDSPKDALINFSHKLLSITRSHIFTEAKNLTITISIGCTKRRESESFADTFKRADKALYKAKNHRNCTHYET